MRNLDDLNGLQALAMYIAILVRNEMEDFHVAHLTDEQMAELNPLIRNAIYTALHASAESEHNMLARKYVNWAYRMIPHYWEPPQLTDDYVYSVEKKGIA